MTLLLDTHLVLWAALNDRRLPQGAVARITDPSNDLAFSAASIWEVVIKRAQGRRDFSPNTQELHRKLLDNGYAELAVSSTHALAVANLPGIHKDPFDRILIAQAVVEGFTLLTSDPTVASYPGPIMRV